MIGCVLLSKMKLQKYFRLKNTPQSYTIFRLMLNEWWLTMVSFCLVVDSHPCSHLFCFERLRLCWCKVRQLSGGGWGVSSLILCTHWDSVSRMALLWVFLFRPWLTIFLFWNIALTFKLREVPPRYSGLQSLSGTTRKKVDWTNTSIGSQTYMKPAARSNSSRLSLSAILCWWISRKW